MSTATESRKKAGSDATADFKAAQGNIFEQMMEGSPLNFIRADSDLIIRYMNPASRATLAKVAHLLPCKVDDIVGNAIDIFHKNPAFQRRLLADPKNLPHRADIRLGPETLNLIVSGIFDDARNYIGSMVAWEIVTERVREAANNAGQLAAISKAQAVTEYQLDGKVIVANEHFLKNTGYTLDEIKGKQHSMFMDEAYSRSSEYREFWAKLNRGESQVGEYKVLAKGGREIWIQASYNSILDADNKPFKVVEYATDITQQKMAASDYAGQIAAIGKSQAVISFRMDGTIIEANDNFLTLMGYTLDEVKGKHHSIFVDEAYRQTSDYKEFWAGLNRGQYQAAEYKRIAKGGKEVWIQASYNPIMDLNGKPFKVVKYATDVTQQKLANSDYAGQIAAIGKSQAVISFRMDGTIIEANDNFLNVMGYTLDEVKGKPHSIFVEESYRRSQDYKDFWAKLNRGEYQAAEYLRIGKGGKEVWIQASYNPIMDLNGKPFKVVKYATDITLQVKAKKEVVEAAEREKIAATELKQKVDSILTVVAAATKGDLTQEIQVSGSDAIGQMGEGLSKFFVDLRQSIGSIGESAVNLASASEELTAVSQQMSANAEETSAQAKVVSGATAQVSQNLQTVATGAEEMGASIKEIAKNATEAAKVATSAVKVAETANKTVSKLGDSSTEIGQVIKVITSIAQQTNLLALNATIEAARAGEAGKGFAVVANEVKELAKETAKATEDISRKIEAIQSDTKAAVDAIASISDVINQVNGISNTIATAVEEQNATTNEMARNVSEAAHGSGEITVNIAGVTEAASSTARGATDTQKAAQQLVATSAELRRLVDRFKIGSENNRNSGASKSVAGA